MASSCNASSLFADLYDEETDAHVEATLLSWRGDAPFSDWSIVITSDDGTTKTYRVHKCILAVGPRRSLYLVNAFRANHLEQQDSTSRITLQANDAEAFPIFLDFMYSHQHFKLDGDNVVALRSLARYFQCTELTNQANRFIEANLNFESALVYIQWASNYNDHGLKETCRKFICLCINRMSAGEDDDYKFDAITIELLATLPKELFCFVMRSSEVQATDYRDASRVVLRFFHHNPNELTAQVLCDLTHDELHGEPILIAPSAAQGIGYLLSQLDSMHEDEATRAKLRHLHDMCVSALATKLKYLDEENWTYFDEEKCKTDILDPSVEGDKFGSSQCAVALLGAAVKHAKLAMVGRVHVSGAGVSAVNGVYIRVGTHDDAPMYTKPTLWHGETRTFTLFRCITVTSDRLWVISVVPDITVAGTEGHVDFYSVRMSRANPDFPPETSWRVSREFVEDPPPRIAMQFPAEV